MSGIERVEISGEQRDKLLSLEEGHYCELKAIEVSTKKLAMTVSALANASGGDLYIGIGETELLGIKIRTWRGFADQEAANGHLQALAAMFPLGADYSYEFLSCAGSMGLVLHITVQRSAQIAKGQGNKVYIRHGAQNLLVRGAEAMKRLQFDKGVDSYEKQPVAVDIAILTKSAKLADFVRQVVPMLTPPVFVSKQALVRSKKPVVAGILLFAEEPQAILPKSGVKLFRYKTTGEGTRETLAGEPKAIEGTIYEIISAAVKETVAMIEGIQKLGPKGLEPVKYPKETLHEIITNAVLHRDYSLASDVQIRIFDNRIEIESPGLLPGHVTMKNFLKTQFSRNGVLVRLIHKFPNPPNKDVGEGLNTAFNAMQKLRLKPPVFEETPNSVVVYIKHETLASSEESVMDYLSNHEEITNRTARSLTGIASENSMKDVFLRLKKRLLIEPVPGKTGAASAWRKYTGGAPASTLRHG